MAYALPAPMPWAALAAPLAAAEDATARLDERLRKSPIREGFNARHDFVDACASLWLEGELVHLEDLVLHDAGMDLRTPTHELTRAHAVLRARRQVAAAPASWAGSAAGLLILRGRGSLSANIPSLQNLEGDPTIAADDDDRDFDRADEDAAETKVIDAIDAVLQRSERLLADAVATPTRPRDELVYDPDWDEDARLQLWQRAVAETKPLPPALAAVLAFDAFEIVQPLQHQPWLGRLLAAATLQARGKTATHLVCFNVGLRAVPRQRRFALDPTTRLVGYLEALSAAAAAGLKAHDRLLLARDQLMRKLGGRRSTSRLPALVDFVLARPIANAAMIAKALRITPRAAQNLVAELGLREATGRSRYRAWGI